MVFAVSSHEFSKNINFFVSVRNLIDFDFSCSIAVDTVNVGIFMNIFKAFLSTRLQFQVYIKPISTNRKIFYFQVSISILSSNSCLYKCAIFERVRVGCILLHQISINVCVLVVSFSWQKSISELRNGKCMQALLCCYNFHQSVWIILFLVPFRETVI